MNKEIDNIIKKNRYRSQFYHQYKKKSSNKPKTTLKKKDDISKNIRDYKIITSLTHKVLISILILFILLISKKDDRIGVIYDTTFKHMNFVQIGNYVEKNFSGLFPTPKNPNKYVNGTVIDMSNTTNYKEGVVVDLELSTPVFSNVEGIVIQMYDDKDFGRVVVIQDIHGYEYHYGYLNDIKVKLYSNVNYGDILGIGKTKDDYSGSYFYLAIKDDDYLDVIQVVNNED